MAFEECKIVGLAVYEYASREDRDKEKIRRPKLSKLISELQKKENILYKELLDILTRWEMSIENLLETDGLIDKSTYTNVIPTKPNWILWGEIWTNKSKLN